MEANPVMDEIIQTILESRYQHTFAIQTRRPVGVYYHSDMALQELSSASSGTIRSVNVHELTTYLVSRITLLENRLGIRSGFIYSQRQAVRDDPFPVSEPGNWGDEL